MLEKLINTSKTEDLLFLSGIVLSMLNEKVYDDEEKSILPELFATMGLEGTINLIKFFGGETITIPSHEDMSKSFLILHCFYKKKVEDKSWDQIKEEVNLDINPHALGKVIQTIEDRLKVEMEDLKEMGFDKLLESMKKKES